jgi:hypothetical protein
VASPPAAPGSSPACPSPRYRPFAIDINSLYAAPSQLVRMGSGHRQYRHWRLSWHIRRIFNIDPSTRAPDLVVDFAKASRIPPSSSGPRQPCVPLEETPILSTPCRPSQGRCGFSSLVLAGVGSAGTMSLLPGSYIIDSFANVTMATPCPTRSPSPDPTVRPTRPTPRPTAEPTAPTRGPTRRPSAPTTVPTRWVRHTPLLLIHSIASGRDQAYDTMINVDRHDE